MAEKIKASFVMTVMLLGACVCVFALNAILQLNRIESKTDTIVNALNQVNLITPEQYETENNSTAQN